MDIKIPLVRFLSKGDEHRFFGALDDIAAIKGYAGSGRELVLKIDRRILDAVMLRELIALLYGRRCGEWISCLSGCEIFSLSPDGLLSNDLINSITVDEDDSGGFYIFKIKIDSGDEKGESKEVEIKIVAKSILLKMKTV